MKNSVIEAGNNLNQKLVFGNFIITEDNIYLYSQSFAVSEFPGESNNPFYLYSDDNNHKTHLINAIGNRIIENNKNFKIYYSTLSDLVHDYIELSEKRKSIISKIPETLDVLLIDDFQYISEWSGNKEGFFDFIKEFIKKGKQVVIGSDTQIDKITGLEKKHKAFFITHIK